jgi:sugar phosphate permease
MWLPFYYKEGLKFSADEAGFLSATFELGGLVGTPLIGYARRAPPPPQHAGLASTNT